MSRRIDQPQPGYFTLRLVKGGPFVPARIHRTCHCTVNGGDDNAAHDWRESCDRYPFLAGEIDGKPANVDRIWTSGQPISRDIYDYLIDLGEWARTYDPEAPEARPEKPVNLRNVRTF